LQSTGAMIFHGSRILLVDNDFDDQFFQERALQKVLRPNSSITMVSSGNEAIAYMIGEGKYADRETYPFPSLIITDLKMPRGDGFDVLEFLKNNPAWNIVPRIVFSSSSDPDDVRTAFLLGASAYHVKAMTKADTEKRMRSIAEYWSSSEVPPVSHTGKILATDSNGRLGARYAKPAGGEVMKRPGASRVPEPL
jgi:CheY-like chemotaxis protein